MINKPCYVDIGKVKNILETFKIPLESTVAADDIIGGILYVPTNGMKHSISCLSELTKLRDEIISEINKDIYDHLFYSMVYGIKSIHLLPKKDYLELSNVLIVAKWV